ncbi:hypothetical protein AJ80_04683 [Polytolypa hystricis UAMH7299]|uniref:Manganese/iron superoxide dismutase C-terminal domain-containing protein n=1 Tax=Polytolypa hystricis (strain UAMH7299) TaxID=1447883 RepID=A0A2B7Y9I7_POLH7|nr:hypothetical protein AJ80_04683 [Polytolypa hystricis UAMH7299]
MILQRLLRPQIGLRAVSSPLSSSLRATTQVRGAHRVPQLAQDSIFVQDGVPNVLSPEGYNLAWTQYQGLMMHKLNALTAGTPDENASPGTLIIKYARDASMASLFNYASMAHNNHFFFNCLSHTPVNAPQELVNNIVESCSSMESLKAEFLATANAMFGPGFVWLVKAKEDGRLKILATYNAGSPYPGAHYRRQPVDMATQTTGSAGGESPDAIRRLQPDQHYGSMGAYSNSRVLAPGGIDVHPILCVNTWEHVWLRDWGIGGKPGFLEAWWNMINWEEVSHNYSQVGARAARSATRPTFMTPGAPKGF